MAEPLHFFLHIPKTAGTTLGEVLAANYPPESILDVYEQAGFQRVRDLTNADVETLRLIQGHMFIHDYEAFFSGTLPLSAITFLRSPAARVVSEYHFLKSWPQQHLYPLMNENNISLEEFVASEHPKLRHHGKNLMTKSLCGAKPDDTEEAMLERAWHNLSERFTCFGLVERFDESLLLLKDALGLSTIFYDRRNVNKKRTSLAELPEETLSLIDEHNQLDLELYSRAGKLLDDKISQAGEGFQAQLRTFLKVNERFQRIAEKLLQNGEENFKDFKPKPPADHSS